ncbi:hypothetical protein V5F59_17235, partial [Xanthobacter autotrophicus DSM 431]|uniref:hypothetical protein n=1 Tax=Xanthobacter nonsaccharivorans TaxID=3119912 RepID=UPI003726A1CD
IRSDGWFRATPPWRGLRCRGLRCWGFAALLLAAAAAPAGATGSFSCNAEDSGLSFTAEAAFSHGMGEALSNFRAELTLKAKGPGKALGPLPLDGAALAQHWLNGGDLRLRLYHEGEGERAVAIDLVVETRRRISDETTFAGRYRLTLSGPGAGGGGGDRILKGRVTCSVG